MLAPRGRNQVQVAGYTPPLRIRRWIYRRWGHDIWRPCLWRWQKVGHKQGEKTHVQRNRIGAWEVFEAIVRRQTEAWLKWETGFRRHGRPMRSQWRGREKLCMAAAASFHCLPALPACLFQCVFVCFCLLLSPCQRLCLPLCLPSSFSLHLPATHDMCIHWKTIAMSNRMVLEYHAIYTQPAVTEN